MTQADLVLGAYAQVLALTRLMLESAQAQQWESLPALEAERRAQLVTTRMPGAPGNVLNPEQVSFLSTQIGEILVLDRQVEELVRARHHELGGVFSSLNTQQRLLDAYGGRNR